MDSSKHIDRLDLRVQHVSHWLLILSLVFALPTFVMLFLPFQVSILEEPTGRITWYFNRNFDLPTGDPSSFYDFSLGPLFAALFACAAFYFFAHKIIREETRPGLNS